MFAFTELGEAIDAHLRGKPEYARNRDKDLDVLDELADCAMMMITALEEDCPPGNVPSPATEHDSKSFQEIAWNLSMAMVKQQDGLSWQSYAYFALCLIAAHPGMDLPARLTARMERIKAKSNPDVTPAGVEWGIRTAQELGMMDADSSQSQESAILSAFYQEVCDQAEKNMANTGTVSGAHWNAMRQVLALRGVEVNR